MRKKATPEHDEQVVYFDWVRRKMQQDWRYELIWAVPNGAKLGGNKRLAAWQMAYLKKEGFKNGVLDIEIAVVIRDPSTNEIIFPGAYIEMKAGSNKPSADQPKLIGQLKDMGYLVVVCYTAEEAINFTRRYLRGSRYE